MGRRPQKENASKGHKTKTRLGRNNAKEGPEGILIKITVHNRGPESASLHVLPTPWFRSPWSWAQGATQPVL